MVLQKCLTFNFTTSCGSYSYFWASLFVLSYIEPNDLSSLYLCPIGLRMLPLGVTCVLLSPCPYNDMCRAWCQALSFVPGLICPRPSSNTEPRTEPSAPSVMSSNPGHSADVFFCCPYSPACPHPSLCLRQLL